MNQTAERADSHGDCRAASCGARIAATIAAVPIAGLLAFTAYAKAVYPNRSPVRFDNSEFTIDGALFDRSIAGFEVLVLVVLLATHRRWWGWAMTALLFGALGGYGLFKSWHGESCGCFAKMFDPPPYSMAAVDAVIVLVSLVMGAWLRAPRAALPAVLVGAVAAGGAGWWFSDLTTPPRRAEVAEKYEGLTAPDRLFASEWMRDIREQPPGGPSWLVFCFDPACHICEEMKPLMDFKREEYEETGDPVLQIRAFSIPEMERELGIEAFAWETPTLMLVQEGRIVRRWAGKELENFTPERLQGIYDSVFDGGDGGDAPAE
jgi:hypothetical protein